MNKRFSFTTESLSVLQFQILAIEHHEAATCLDTMTSWLRSERRMVREKTREYAALKQELATERGRIATNEFEEGERQQRMAVLTQTIASFVIPQLVDEERCRLIRTMWKQKMQETQHRIRSLLVWEAQADRAN